MGVDFYYKLISIKIFIKHNLVDDLFFFFFYLSLDKSFSAMLLWLYIYIYIYFLVYYHCLFFLNMIQIKSFYLIDQNYNLNYWIFF